jgi:hypothetical protein
VFSYRTLCHPRLWFFTVGLWYHGCACHGCAAASLPGAWKYAQEYGIARHERCWGRSIEGRTGEAMSNRHVEVAETIGPWQW